MRRTDDRTRTNPDPTALEAGGENSANIWERIKLVAEPEYIGILSRLIRLAGNSKQLLQKVKNKQEATNLLLEMLGSDGWEMIIRVAEYVYSENLSSLLISGKFLGVFDKIAIGLSVKILIPMLISNAGLTGNPSAQRYLETSNTTTVHLEG